MDFFRRVIRDPACGVGSNHVFMIGVMMTGFLAAPFAVDLPMYYAAQNQLQTAVNAAALAGAAELPVGEWEAEQAAYEYAAENPVMNQELMPENLTYAYDGSSFSVSAQMEVPTMMSKLFCSMQELQAATGGLDGPDGEDSGVGGEDGEESSSSSCATMTVAANAKAVPAARDVILVIDTSSSMLSLGYGQPFYDVKDAATAYVDQVIQLDSESIDRIGVVTFDYSSDTAIGLTSTYDSDGFEEVKDAIDDLDTYSGNQSWNTNYYAGLKEALDELEQNGRKNANKSVVFLTDGYPNLPDGAYYYMDCIQYYNNAQYYEYYANYYKKKKRYSYANYYQGKADENYDDADSCATGYTDHMVSVTQAQAQRAAEMDVKVYTIQIGGPPEQSNSTQMLKAMMRDDDWDPMLLEYIADTTDGDQYAAEGFDGPAILAIYETIAKDVHMRLAL